MLAVPLPVFDCKNTETEVAAVAVKVILLPAVVQSQPLMLLPP